MSDRFVTQLRKGLVELSILAQLKRGESYGYALLKSLEAYRGLELTESTVYPALARMLEEGWLSARMVESSKGPPRRYYKLTLDGEARLEQIKVYWRGITAAIEDLLDEADGSV